MTRNASPAPPPDDGYQHLHALADGRLQPAEAEALRARLDAGDLARVQDWQRQRDGLRALHAAALDDADIPPEMRRAAGQLQDRHNRHARWSRWGGIAAGWLLAFGLGWGLHGGHDAQPSPAPGAGAPLAFAQQAAAAHAVFQPEQRHPVEVTAAQQQHLVQWLSKRLGRPLAVPVLATEGFDLMGGRLLPGDGGARAQFMYQNAQGQRVTLYVGAIDAGRAAPTAEGGGETAFRFHEEGAISSFYWVDRGFGYALSGEMPRATLLALATAAHRQLGMD